MSYASDCDEDNYFSNHWTSSDSQSPPSKMSSEGSDEINDKIDSSSDELNVGSSTGYNREKLSLSESDSKLNFASNTHSADFGTFEAHSNKSDSEVDEIPNLVNDDYTDDTEISDDRKSEEEPTDEVDDEFIMKELEKLIIRRNKKDNESRMRLFCKVASVIKLFQVQQL